MAFFDALQHMSVFGCIPVNSTNASQSALLARFKFFVYPNKMWDRALRRMLHLHTNQQRHHMSVLMFQRCKDGKLWRKLSVCDYHVHISDEFLRICVTSLPHVY